MDYNVAASKERLTGRAYFNPGLSGGLGITSMPWLDLGNVQMMNLAYGLKTKEHMKARRGLVYTDRSDAYAASPKWELTCDEFTSTTLFLIFLGTAAANVVQTSRINFTKTFQAHLGGVLDLGLFSVYNWSIGALVSGADYIVDAGPGKE